MTFQARQRDPLMDFSWWRAIERRSAELVGMALVLGGVLVALSLGSYSAQDSGVLTASSTPIHNLLGSTGAFVASVLIVTIGLSAWSFPLFLGAWGFRMLAHLGGDRLSRRIFFLPLLVVCASFAASAFAKPDWWPHHFGIGGMLGDTLYGTLVYMWPQQYDAEQQFIPHGTIAALAISMFLSLGFTFGELWSICRACLPRVRSRSRKAKAEAVSVEAPAATSRKKEERGQGFAVLAMFKRRRTDTRERKQGVRKIRRSDKPAQEPKLSQAVESSEIEEGLPQATAGVGRRERRSMLRRFGSAVGTVFDSGEVTDEDMFERRRVMPDLSRRTQSILEEQPETIPNFEEIAPREIKEPDPQPEPLVRNPIPKKRAPSKKALREAAPPLIVDEQDQDVQEPPLSLLQEPTMSGPTGMSEVALEENARMLEVVLNDYGVKGIIKEVRPGPVVTLYELMPEPGLKASRVVGLADDIARNMSAISARISTVPGRKVIGIELPNDVRETVLLRELLGDRVFGDSSHELPIALGKDIGGAPKIVDLSKMPHLLIAGTTGSGKSVAVNTMILSLLYRLSPEECRLIMIDPKMLELSVYDGIPHLLSPVVTDPKKAIVALKWVVAEMEERYRKMSKMGVRKLTSYNDRVREALRQGKTFSRKVQTGFDEAGDPVFVEEEFEPKTLPYFVVIVDEMADLMMVAGKEIEACIQRLAQMARASGIHVVMATQRPSVDVITGTIKANFPTRISFQVTSKIDSRTILGEQGAEQLLGRGDMLYMAGGGQIERIHGPFVSDEEVEEVVNFLKQFGPPDYVEEVLNEDDGSVDAALGIVGGNSDDKEYDMAVQVVLRDRKCSTSYIQRKLEIGYNKAARLVERMEEEGLISPANHVGKRDILVPE